MGDPKGQSNDRGLFGGGRVERRPDPHHDPLLRPPRQRAHQDGARHGDLLRLAGAGVLQRGGRVRAEKEKFLVFIRYRVVHHVSDLGLVDSDWACSALCLG